MKKIHKTNKVIIALIVIAIIIAILIVALTQNKEFEFKIICLILGFFLHLSHY